MRIKKEEVEYLSHLARLELTEKEKEKISYQLEIILNYVEKLNQLDTNKIPPTSHVLPLENVLREDGVKNSLSMELLLSIAPATHKNFFKVPRVIN